MAPSYIIPALQRSFEVIHRISEHPDGITFTNLLDSLDMPKSTLFRILHTLETGAWVEKRSDRYHLGYMLIHHGLTALSRRGIKDTAAPILEKLVQETGETSHLAVPSGQQSMILDVRITEKHIKTTSSPGKLLPLYCTSHGKIFLAYLVKENLDGFYYGQDFEQHTEKTITSLENLRTEMLEIRQNGYAMDDEEFIPNVRCCAAPVFSPSGECIGALGITATTMTFTPDKREAIAASVKEAADELSRQMGSIKN